VPVGRLHHDICAHWRLFAALKCRSCPPPEGTPTTPP
jgi:hypothetical protein